MAVALLLPATPLNGGAVSLYDEDGPFECPPALPTGGPTEVFFAKTWDIAWNQTPTYKVPFTITGLILDSQSQTIGDAFYEPIEGVETTFEGKDWWWVDALLQYTCVNALGLSFRFPTPGVAPSGYALLMGDSNPPNSGGGELPECWDIYDWWIDSSGYHETYRGQICEGDYGEWET